jgi:hypothetical protein
VTGVLGGLRASEKAPRIGTLAMFEDYHEVNYGTREFFPCAHAVDLMVALR